jgi:predicted TPR repeat methyltransferase
VSADQERLQEAIARHRAGDHDGAEVGYCEHLRAFPNDPSGLHFLGLLRSHQGRDDEAIKFMESALSADPEYVDAWSNLGIAYFHKRDLQRAESCSRKAIELAPGFANAWANLGMTLRARGAVEEALTAWRRALELQPSLHNVAVGYGHLLYRLDRNAEALQFYRHWQSASPDDPIPEHMLAALGGEPTPARASDRFVRATFDDFAATFDRNLAQLEYRAPQLLCDAVIQSGRLPAASGLEILDLGCGTGLCGPLLRPLASTLVGVDLSCKMLAQAAGRGLYDQLNWSELTHWLAACAKRFRLVIAADVLCYFGDLSAVFERIAGVLAPDGCLACSLEALADAGSTPSFVLQPHGRYQHRREYVEATLNRAGLRAESLKEGVLRMERGEAVAGHLVVAVREASA